MPECTPRSRRGTPPESPQRLRGWRWVRRLLSFVLACSVGAVANAGIATYPFYLDSSWLLSALAGVLVGAVWNDAVTAVYTWRSPKRA